MVTGTTAGAVDDERGLCFTGSGGRDVVYQFTTTTTQTLTARVTGGTLQNPALYLRQSACASGVEVGCDVGAGGTAELRVTLVAGTHYLVVDSNSASASGSFTLAAGFGGGDTCAAAKTLSINGGSDSSSTAIANDDYTLSCGGSGGRDLVYTFSNSLSGQPFSASIVPGPGFGRPTISARSGCSMGSTTHVCASSTADSAAVTVTVPSLPFGPQFLFVDGARPNDYGPYTVTTVTGAAAMGDSCTAPHALVLSNGSHGLGIVKSTTEGMVNSAQGSCGGLGVDQVYRFTTTTARTLTAWVVPDDNTYWPYLYLKTGATCLGATDVAGACNSPNATGQSAVLTQIPIPAGTYYLWVDGFSGTSGGYTLNVAVQ